MEQADKKSQMSNKGAANQEASEEIPMPDDYNSQA